MAVVDIRTGKEIEMTRRDFGKGLAAIISSGVAPSVMAFGRRGLGLMTAAWAKSGGVVPKVLLFNDNGVGKSWGHASYSGRNIETVSFGGWMNVQRFEFCQLIGWAATGPWGGLSIGFLNDHKVYFRGGDSSAVFEGGTLRNNEWHHLFAVKNVDKMRLFVNGTMLNEVSCPAVTSSNVGLRFRIIGGTNYTDTDTVNRYYRGSLAGVCAFNRALSDEEVKDIYDNKKLIEINAPPYNDGLWFGWNMTKMENGTVKNEVDGELPLTIESPLDVINDGKEFDP